MTGIKKYLKNKVKNFIINSEKTRKIIKKMNEIAKEEELINSRPASKTISVSKPSNSLQKTEKSSENDVIYPIVKEYLYNKRINNYLLEKTSSYKTRRWVIEQMYYNVIGRFPNLDNPKSLNEKMQWMRFNYHDSLMTKCVDKCSFKEYIKDTVGEEYVVPLYGVWDNVNDINFDDLPNKFAIKSTWGWGDLQNILVKNKYGLNLHKTRAMLSNWMQEWNNYYYQSFEWDSKDIKPRIIAEELLEPSCGEIIDYKFYCYNGKCRHFLICKDRKTKTKYINYDLDYNCIKLSPNSYVTNEKFIKTKEFDKMFELAEKLAKPFPLVRVDFYDVDGKIYVGELTFSPGGGFNTYYEEWDNKLGSWLTLPEANVSSDELL